MTIMMWERTGSVSVTNGSATVTGTDTTFQTSLFPGDTFTMDNSTLYEIVAIPDDLTFILDRPYEGTTATGVPYAVIPNSTRRSSISEQTQRVNRLIERYRGTIAVIEQGGWFENTSGDYEVAGETDRNIVPKQTDNKSIGTATRRWLSGFFKSLFVNGMAVSPSISPAPNKTPVADTDGRLHSGYLPTVAVLKDEDGLVPDALLSSAIARSSDVTAHTGNTNNPHGVTRAQIGAAASDHTHSPGDIEAAPLDSPEFTGTPTAPNASVATDSTQIATTSFVQSLLRAFGLTLNGNTLPSVSDLNSLVTPGFYSGSGASGTNWPGSTQYGFVLVLRRDAQVTQIALYETSNQIYIRTSLDTGATWSSWRDILTSTDMNAHVAANDPHNTFSSGSSDQTTDWNEMITPGFTKLMYGTNPNGPGIAGYLYCVVWKYGNTSVAQLALPYSNPLHGVWVRQMYAGTPGAWKKLSYDDHTHGGGDITSAVANATTAANCSRSVTAGNGLTGGGALTADRTLTLGTPGSCSPSTSNAVTSTSHTHAITGVAATSHAHDGTYIPIPSTGTLPVGSYALCVPTTSVANGSTISGSNLKMGGVQQPSGYTSASLWPQTPQSGTWKNVSGITCDNTKSALFIRTA